MNKCARDTATSQQINHHHFLSTSRPDPHQPRSQVMPTLTPRAISEINAVAYLKNVADSELEEKSFCAKLGSEPRKAAETRRFLESLESGLMDRIDWFEESALPPRPSILDDLPPLSAEAESLIHATTLSLCNDLLGPPSAGGASNAASQVTGTDMQTEGPATGSSSITTVPASEGARANVRSGRHSSDSQERAKPLSASSSAAVRRRRWHSLVKPHQSPGFPGFQDVGASASTASISTASKWATEAHRSLEAGGQPDRLPKGVPEADLDGLRADLDRRLGALEAQLQEHKSFTESLHNPPHDSQPSDSDDGSTPTGSRAA